MTVKRARETPLTRAKRTRTAARIADVFSPARGRRLSSKDAASAVASPVVDLAVRPAKAETAALVAIDDADSTRGKISGDSDRKPGLDSTPVVFTPPSLDPQSAQEPLSGADGSVFGTETELKTADQSEAHATPIKLAPAAPLAGRARNDVPEPTNRVASPTRATIADVAGDEQSEKCGFAAQPTRNVFDDVNGLHRPETPAVAAPPSPTLRVKAARAAVQREAEDVAVGDEANAELPTIDVESTLPFEAQNAVPAYERYAGLLAPRAALPMPAHFQVLQRVLGALDSLCMVHRTRDQPAVFLRLCSALNDAVGRTIGPEHVDALLEIMPGCYTRQDVHAVWHGRRVRTFVLGLPEGAGDAAALFERRTELSRRMMARVHAQHSVFLRAAGHVLPPGAVLRTWHPDFDLDSVAPHIGAVSGAPEYVPETPHAAERVTAPPKDKTLSLLERVRLREKQAAIRAMAGDPVRDARRAELQALLQTAAAMAMLFAQNAARSVIPLADAAARVANGRELAGQSASSIRARIASLCAAAPEWVSADAHYVRVNRAVSYAAVRTKLQAELDALC